MSFFPPFFFSFFCCEGEGKGTRAVDIVLKIDNR